MLGNFHSTFTSSRRSRPEQFLLNLHRKYLVYPPLLAVVWIVPPYVTYAYQRELLRVHWITL